ncbi:hypothetical protein [Streptosporangium sp. NPDC051022]|uniref:hypothetical protein n=1 Tax=Streptosporangium sp. NPDC051022 TaxID=3155752 RepID=UPI00341C585D
MEDTTIEAIQAMPPGAGRARAAHEATEDANIAAAIHRQTITGLVAVLEGDYGHTKADLGRSTGIAVQNLFPPNAVLPRPKGKAPKEPQAVKQLAEEATGYRDERAKAKAVREIRRDDVAALYQGALDGRQWETGEIARETGMSDSLVKADLKARGVDLRPATGPRTASLDDESATLAEIARMLRVDYKRLKDAVQAHTRSRTLPEEAEAGGGAADDRRYVPRVVAEWWPTIRSAKRVAYAPQGAKLSDLARRYGENYEKVKTAVRYAERAGELAEGVRNDDGTFNEQAWLEWWRARGVTLSDIAAEQGVDYEKLRQRVRAFLSKHELAEGVRLDSGRWNRERFLAEVWPSVQD